MIRIQVILALCLSLALPGAAFAQNECEILNQIIDSGLGHQNPFAAVAGVTLPNADECEVEFGDHDDKRNSFACSWNKENEKILDEMDEEESELFTAYLDHDGGYDARDEAQKFIDKANYWYKTYNYGLRQLGQPTSAQAAYMMAEWKEKGQAFERKARAKEEEATTLDREYEEAEAKYDVKKAEVEQFKAELEKLSDRQAGDLYTGLYACFNRGVIRNAEAYMVDPQAKSWTQDGGCNINIGRGPTLSVYCPNPNYQSQ